MRYALISANGLVENVIEYDENASLDIPTGYQLIKSDSANIGWTYAENAFTEPAERPEISEN